VVVEGIINRTPTLLLSKKNNMVDHFNSEGAYITATENNIIDKLEQLNVEAESIIQRCNDKASYYNYKDDGGATTRVVEYIDYIVKRKEK
jgi:hypothetical protein